MFLYWAPPSKEPWQPSPEEMQQVFSQWSAWKEKFKRQVVDMGDGLKPGGTRFKGGEVTDGPLPEAKEIVNGFSIVQASSIEDALKVARECPIHLMPGASIEIREMKGY
jgi:hypothetical protein